VEVAFAFEELLDELGSPEQLAAARISMFP